MCVEGVYLKSGARHEACPFGNVLDMVRGISLQPTLHESYQPTRQSLLSMLFKRAIAAEDSFRRLKGFDWVAEVIRRREVRRRDARGSSQAVAKSRRLINSAIHNI